MKISELTSQDFKNKLNKKLYATWKNVRNRALHKTSHREFYKDIDLCGRWTESYANFKEDLEASFLEHCLLHGISNTSIDRIDNSKGYSLENCRWATPYVQSNNRNSCIHVQHNGKNQTLTQWCKELGLSFTTISQRVRVLGWTPEEALGLVPRDSVKIAHNAKYISYNGETKTTAQWADFLGISSEKIGNRLRAGWTVGEALEFEKRIPPKKDLTTRKQAILFTHNGETKTLKEWNKHFGIVGYSTVQYRVSTLGMDIFEALTTPAKRKSCAA